MRSPTCVLLACFVVLSAGRVFADTPSKWVSARLAFSAAGESDVEDTESDLDPSLGAEALFHGAVHENVALYGGLGFLFWKADGTNGDSNRFIDLTVGPLVRYPVTPRVNVFVAGRFGGTISTIGEDEFLGGNVDSAIGWHIGGRLGAQVAATDHVGGEVDLGIVSYHATHEVDTILGSTDVEGSTWHLMLRIGVFYTLGI